MEPCANRLMGKCLLMFVQDENTTSIEQLKRWMELKVGNVHAMMTSARASMAAQAVSAGAVPLTDWRWACCLRVLTVTHDSSILQALVLLQL